MTLTLLTVSAQAASVFFLSIQGAHSQLLNQVFGAVSYSQVFLLISYLQYFIDILVVQVSKPHRHL